MKQTNAKQKQFMSDVAEWASENIHKLYGGMYMGAHFQIHHVAGRSAKHNKVPIGHEFILPVPIELHDVHSNHPDNVTHFKKNFVKRFGNQRDLFFAMYLDMIANGYQVPEVEIVEAIRDTRA